MERLCRVVVFPHPYDGSNNKLVAWCLRASGRPGEFGVIISAGLRGFRSSESECPGAILQCRKAWQGYEAARLAMCQYDPERVTADYRLCGLCGEVFGRLPSSRDGVDFWGLAVA